MKTKKEGNKEKKIIFQNPRTRENVASLNKWY